MTNNAAGKIETFTYQAEVAQVMDIVINSLYTDKEIFIRELISNTVDALEKIRHLQLTEPAVEDRDLPLEIQIKLDETARTFTISDTGIGMTRDELITNLGSIAHSGAKDFLVRLADNIRKDISLIGQFGVGFYSAFMVAKKITVHTKSYLPGSTGYEWISEGTSGYTIAPKENLTRGTTIVIELKDNPSDPEAGFSYDDFTRTYVVERIVRQYSNFVPFPIKVNDKRINTIEAIWARNKNEIKPEEYTEFYKFVSGAFDEPFDLLHFTTDAPLSLKALLFIPKENYERLGLGKIETNVDLHCRKILIQKSAKGLLPPWLRFLRGVIDSEDIPLNISRETMQDSALVKKINKAVTRRFLKFLEDLASENTTRYAEFFKTFGIFIKEGVISDFEHRAQLAGLLRFESSKTTKNETTSLKEYVERAGKDQKDIYYLNGSSRDSIESGPYLEIFKKQNIEVLYTLDPVDDFVMSHLKDYEGKKLVSADAEKLNLPEEESKPEDAVKSETLDSEQSASLAVWIKTTLGDKITEARESKRLIDSPVILVNPEGELSGAMQRLMETMSEGMKSPGKRILEFNPGHRLIRKLDEKRSRDPELAVKILEQIFDSAAITAGVSIDSRVMVQRMYEIVEKAMD